MFLSASVLTIDSDDDRRCIPSPHGKTLIHNPFPALHS